MLWTLIGSPPGNREPNKGTGRSVLEDHEARQVLKNRRRADPTRSTNGSAFLDDLPVTHRQHAREVRNDLLVVRGDDAARTSGGCPLDRPEHALATRPVLVTDGLVGAQDLGRA